MKKCYRCKKEKSTSEFSKNARNKDGVCGSCKECRSVYERAYYLKNRDTMLERSGQYRKDHIEAARAYDRTHTKEHQATRRNLAPEKHQARAGVARAVSRGDIKRLACEICSETKNIHAHHEDYSKPLDVVWLCVSCHGLRHREINDEQKEQAVGD